MSVFVWHSGLSVGNPAIDRQHEALLRLGGRVAAVLERPDSGRSEFHAVLNDLAVALSEHFAFEERLLEANGCPTLAEHRAEHDALHLRLTNVLLLGLGDDDDRNGLLRTIEDWTLRHLVEHDLVCREYMRP